MIFSLLLFFFLTISLGSICAWAGFKKENFFERILICCGTGIALIPITGALFNLFKIPLSYKSFFFLGCAILLLTFFYLWKKNKQTVFSFKPRQIISWQDAATAALFLISLLVYLRGSLSFSWLGSDDPYRFAAAIKYIEIEKTFTAPFRFVNTSQPYPQGYQILMALLSQASQSLNWALKFFTSLLASLSLFFFYFLANKLLKNKTAALFSTFALAAIPAWLTHYIFALNLNLVLLPLFFYTLKKAGQNQVWAPIPGLILASLYCTHFYSAFITTLILGAYFLANLFSGNSPSKKLIFCLSSGLTLSLTFWIPSSLIQFPGRLPGGMSHIISLAQKLATEITFLAGTIFFIFSLSLFLLLKKRIYQKFPGLRQKITSPKAKLVSFYLLLTALLFLLLVPDKKMPVLGTATIPYTWRHFLLFRTPHNVIQNPFGIGILPLTLAIAAFFYLIFQKSRLFTLKNKNYLTIFFIAILTFLGVMSGRFSLNLMPFRMWVFFAFSVALLNGIFYNEFVAKVDKNKLKIAAVLILAISFIPTWYQNKYKLNASFWGDGFVPTMQSKEFYGWIKDNLPKNSKVYALGVTQYLPIAFDMLSLAWDKDVEEYLGKDIVACPAENYAFLKKKGYQYIAIDYPSVFTYTLNYNPNYSQLPLEIKEEIALYKSALAQANAEFMAKLPHYELIEEFDFGKIFKLN